MKWTCLIRVYSLHGTGEWKLYGTFDMHCFVGALRPFGPVIEEHVE